MSQIKNKLDKASLIKIGKGAGIMSGAVFLFYVLQGLTQIDFGTANPIIVGVLSILINSIREFLKGEKLIIDVS